MRKTKFILKSLPGKIFAKPTESPTASKLLIKTVWILRIFIYVFGLFQFLKGEPLLGVLIIVCVLFLAAPSVFTRSRITDIPLELEFFLFIMVFFQFILGEAHGLYGNVAFYDDIIHFFFPFLISVMGFTIVYALYFSGKLKVSTGTMILFVIIVTLGIGAFWEIIEYSSDKYLLPNIDNWHRFQGTNAQNAIQDTMDDLVSDLWGGIVGAIIASRYILEAKYNKRLKELFKEIVRHFFGGRVTQ